MQKVAGLLCPLPVPHRPWEDLSLDFIVGLPAYHGNTTILVVVDRFSKGIHLGMLPASHTAHMVASLFIDMVVKIHGVPRNLVFDRDPLFISKFWQELFKASGTHLRMNSAYHPQSDGQTEVLNRIVEQYLRASSTDDRTGGASFYPGSNGHITPLGTPAQAQLLMR